MRRPRSGDRRLLRRSLVAFLLATGIANGSFAQDVRPSLQQEFRNPPVAESGGGISPGESIARGSAGGRPRGGSSARGPFGGPPGGVSYWWIAPSETTGGDLSISLLSAGYTLGDLYKRGQWTFSARPQLETLFLGGPGPRGPDLPEQAYGFGIDLRADWKVKPRLSVQLAVTPGLYTDLDNLSSEAFRVPARLFATYFSSPKLILMGGVVYTTQPQLPVIPAAGAIWNPSPKWSYQFIFPRPRIVYRYSDQLEFFALGVFNTNTYGIESAGMDEVFQYRDFRFGVGAEWFSTSDLRLQAEVGIAFGRELGFDLQSDRAVDPGFFFQFGARF